VRTFERSDRLAVSAALVPQRGEVAIARGSEESVRDAIRLFRLYGEAWLGHLHMLAARTANWRTADDWMVSAEADRQPVPGVDRADHQG
jgi:hypothetical protein